MISLRKLLSPPNPLKQPHPLPFELGDGCGNVVNIFVDFDSPDPCDVERQISISWRISGSAFVCRPSVSQGHYRWFATYSGRKWWVEGVDIVESNYAGSNCEHFQFSLDPIFNTQLKIGIAKLLMIILERLAQISPQEDSFSRDRVMQF